MAKPWQKWGELGVVADVAWTDGRPGSTRLRRKFERLPFYLFPPPLVALFLALLWYDNEAPLCNFVIYWTYPPPPPSHPIPSGLKLRLENRDKMCIWNFQQEECVELWPPQIRFVGNLPTHPPPILLLKFPKAKFALELPINVMNNTQIPQSQPFTPIKLNK